MKVVTLDAKAEVLAPDIVGCCIWSSLWVYFGQEWFAFEEGLTINWVSDGGVRSQPPEFGYPSHAPPENEIVSILDSL